MGAYSRRMLIYMCLRDVTANYPHSCASPSCTVLYTSLPGERIFTFKSTSDNGLWETWDDESMAEPDVARMSLANGNQASRCNYSMYEYRLLMIYSLRNGASRMRAPQWTRARARARPLGSSSRCNTAKYCRPGFNCVVKQLRFWLFEVDCEFKDCDLRVLHAYWPHLRNRVLQFAIFKLRN